MNCTPLWVTHVPSFADFTSHPCCEIFDSRIPWVTFPTCVVCYHPAGDQSHLVDLFLAELSRTILCWTIHMAPFGELSTSALLSLSHTLCKSLFVTPFRRGNNTVVVFKFNRSFYPTASAVPPVSFLILHPGEIRILWSDSETEKNQTSLKN